MRFHVLTLFPEMIEQAVGFGVVGQAMKDGKLQVSTLSPRTFTTNVHQTVDDRPFGGGDGMIMMAEPMAQALETILAAYSGKKPRVIHLSPRGRPFSDPVARELALGQEAVVLIASRYGGLDQRFIDAFVDEEISIGDYVLSGGEIPSLAVIDAVARHIPGVLGNKDSAQNESFAFGGGLLEHPQYTRPRVWRETEVPEELLSGNHAQIDQWKKTLSLLTTLGRRPDLLEAWLEAWAAAGLGDAAILRERLRRLGEQR